MSDEAQRAAEYIHTSIESNLHHLFGAAELKWSPNMPDDDPHADWVVVHKRTGKEYTLEIDVWLNPTGNTLQEGTQ